MKTTDKAELIRLAREAYSQVPGDENDLFAQIDDLLAEDEAKSRTLVKPRVERE
jgi:hypothetical protein